MPVDGSIARAAGVTVAMDEVAGAAALETSTRYCVGTVGVTTTLEAFEPGRFTQLAPSNDCHWYAVAPLATTKSVAELPGQTGCESGWVVISGPTESPTCPTRRPVPS